MSLFGDGPPLGGSQEVNSQEVVTPAEALEGLIAALGADAANKYKGVPIDSDPTFLLDLVNIYKETNDTRIATLRDVLSKALDERSANELHRMETLQTQHEIDSAKAEVDDADLELTQFEELVEALKDFNDGFQKVGVSGIDQEALAARLSTSRDLIARRLPEAVKDGKVDLKKIDKALKSAPLGIQGRQAAADSARETLKGAVTAAGVKHHEEMLKAGLTPGPCASQDKT